MSNIKNTAAGLLIFAMNIIYPQIQKVNKVIDTSIKKDNFNGLSFWLKTENRITYLYRIGEQTL